MQKTFSVTKAKWLKYASIWSNSDAGARKNLLEECVAADCNYSDPEVKLVGHEQLSDYMQDCLNQYPGIEFRTTNFLEHHSHSLALWDMIIEGEVLVAKGDSFAK